MKDWKPNSPPFIDFKRKVFTQNIRVADFIYQIGESEILRNKSKPIDISKIRSKATQAKIEYLKKCLLRYRKLTGYGRGMTAVQVGIPERFSVIYKGQTIKNIKNKMSVDEKDLMIVINPKIIKKSKKLLKYPEACMSASPVVVPTIRPSWIEFEYYDQLGKKHNWITKDNTAVGKMMNRVFMHEIDHMDGIINIDKVKNPKEIILQSDPKFYDRAKFEEV